MRKTLGSIALALAIVACQEPSVLTEPKVVEWDDGGMKFRVTSLSPTMSRIETETEPWVSPAGGALSQFLRCAQLTVDKGFRYFTSEHESTAGWGKASYLLTFYDTPPAGHHIVDFRGPPPENPEDLFSSDQAMAFDAVGMMELVGPLPAPGESPPPAEETVAPTEPGKLQRTVFLEMEEIDRIRSIRQAQFRPDSSVEICVAGRLGAAFLGLDGDVHSRIRFDDRVGLVEPIDVEGDGVFEFFNRGGGWSQISLLDHQGRLVWKHPAERGLLSPSPNATAAGDLDGDGTLEFVVSYNARDGLHVLDATGKFLRTISADVSHDIEILDIDSDGELEIVSNDGGRATPLVIRNSQGVVEQRLPLGSLRVLWSPDGSPQLVGFGDGAVLIHDFDARLVGKYLPVSDRGRGVGEAVYVRLDRSMAPYLAVVRTIGASAGKSEMYVFSPSGDLLHREPFSVAYLAIAAKDVAEDGEQSLLVGAGTTVWEYRLNR